MTRLEDTVSRLTTPHSTIYLVGTCHVSKASADEVTSLVRQHTPETVLVELCRARADRLMEGVTEEEEAKRFMSALVKGSGVGTAMSSSLSMMGKAGLARAEARSDNDIAVRKDSNTTNSNSGTAVIQIYDQSITLVIQIRR